MKTSISNDFATLFSYQWYQGFPLDGWNRDHGSVSDWTTHSAITFRNTADLFGYFVHFESGGKSDAVLRNSKKEPVAFAEWEWQDPVRNEINEPSKLSAAYLEHKPEFCFLLTYVDEEKLPSAVDKIAAQWPHPNDLILCLVTYSGKGFRTFKELVFFRITLNSSDEIRRQPALPWLIKNSRWLSE